MSDEKRDGLMSIIIDLSYGVFTMAELRIYSFVQGSVVISSPDRYVSTRPMKDRTGSGNSLGCPSAISHELNLAFLHARSLLIHTCAYSISLRGSHGTKW